MQVLHQHKDIHLPGESEDEETTELLKDGFKKIKSSLRDRNRGAGAKEGEEKEKKEEEEQKKKGELVVPQSAVEAQLCVEDRDQD